MRPVECAHWHQFFKDLSVSPKDFYQTLADGLKERQVPTAKVAQIERLERGLLSDKRLYLEVHRDWLTYYVCAAPFGTGFFVSSRLLFDPFKTWTVLLANAGILAALLFVAFMVLTSQLKSVALAVVAIVIISVPVAIIYALFAVFWIINRMRMTYYRVDTMLAFHDAVHGLLVETINKVIEPAGRKPLSSEETKPVLHRLLRGGSK